MLTLQICSTANGDIDVQTSSGDRAVESTHDELLAKLVELWSRHRRAGLEVRLATGQLLNEELGEPAGRQSYGDGVLKACAAKLGLAVSELSRMRCFAANYESLDDLAQRHPEVTTWTQVKSLLPALRCRKEGMESITKAPKADVVPTPSRTPVRRVIKTLSKIHSRLDGVHLDKTEAIWTELNDTIRDLVAAASEALGVSYTLVRSTAPNGDGTTSR
jgi:hypothetical protein